MSCWRRRGDWLLEDVGCEVGDEERIGIVMENAVYDEIVGLAERFYECLMILVMKWMV